MVSKWDALAAERDHWRDEYNDCLRVLLGHKERADAAEAERDGLALQVRANADTANLNYRHAERLQAALDRDASHTTLERVCAKLRHFTAKCRRWRETYVDMKAWHRERLEQAEAERDQWQQQAALAAADVAALRERVRALEPLEQACRAWAVICEQGGTGAYPGWRAEHDALERIRAALPPGGGGGRGRGGVMASGTWGLINNPPAPPRHRCMVCTHEWPATDIWLRWPIRVRLRRDWARRARRWGWQVGTRSDGRRVFGWTWRWGPFKVYVGPSAWGYRHPSYLACPHCYAVHWRQPAAPPEAAP